MRCAGMREKLKKGIEDTAAAFAVPGSSIPFILIRSHVYIL